MKTLIKKNDNVTAIAGRNRGKSGRVLAVYPDKGVILVEGLNFVKKAIRPTQKNPQGGISQIEAPFRLSNAQFQCGKCKRPVRLGSRFLKDGSKERFCRKCGEAS